MEVTYNDFSGLIQILPRVTGDRYWRLGSVVLCEELLYGSSCDDTSSLVVEECTGCTFEDLDGVAQAFEDNAGEEST